MRAEPWNEEDKETLRQLWPDQKVSAISKIVNRSRNAVIGMAHRMKLPAKDRNEGRRRKKPLPMHLAQFVAAIAPRRPVLKAINPVPEATEPEPEYNGPIPLIDAQVDQCRAVIEGLKDGDGLAMVCGKPVVFGQPFSFCSEHLKLFTVKGGR